MKNFSYAKLLVISVFLFILTYGVANATPLIGSCYKYVGDIDSLADSRFVNMTGIQSFRYRMSWGQIDDLLLPDDDSHPPDWRYHQVVDTINKYMPSGVTRIFQLKFWHPDDMDVPSGWDDSICFGNTFKVKEDSVDVFKDMCYDLAAALRGNVDYFVLHNEPNMGWDPIYGDRKWRNSPEDFAWQCKICAEQMKAANPDAYIIFGSFSGTDTTDEFIQRSTNAMFSGNEDLVDAIDFHWYFPPEDSTQTYEWGIRAHSMHQFCQSRGVDWTVLETSGPKIVLPVDEKPDSLPYGDNIREYLVHLVRDLGINDDAVLLDSLYFWVRDIDPDNIGLPENYEVLDSIKVDEFNRRIPLFVDSGAVIAHWFAAFIDSLHSVDEEWYCDQPQSGGAESRVYWLIRNAQNVPRNLIELPYYKSTALSKRMNFFIDSLGNPKIAPPINGDNSKGKSGGISLWNYPNAFNSSTEIKYYLPDEMEVKLEIFNLLGRRMDILYKEKQTKGYHNINWKAKNYPSGIYFCRLSSKGKSQVMKMTLLK